MFKSLDSIASVVGNFMYLTISKFKQVLRSQKGLDYNTDVYEPMQCLYIQERWMVSYTVPICYSCWCLRLDWLTLLCSVHLPIELSDLSKPFKFARLKGLKG